jgi:hypothetical protein
MAIANLHAFAAPMRSRAMSALRRGCGNEGKSAFFSGSPTISLGNARLRKALWMVVLNAVRCNPWLRQYYERLRAAGKPGKVAVIAAMRRLLTAVWSVATHRKPFVPHLPRCACPTRRSHEQGLMNSTLSSPAKASDKSVRRSGAEGVQRGCLGRP